VSVLKEEAEKMTQTKSNSLVKSFLNTEIRVLAAAALLALFVMTVLFIFPVFVKGSPRFSELTDMTIVTKVVLPLQLALAAFAIGTLVNILLCLIKTIRRA
jgi:ABC-type glycerol-3-phosphate transport system permease component